MEVTSKELVNARDTLASSEGNLRKLQSRNKELIAELGLERKSSKINHKKRGFG